MERSFEVKIIYSVESDLSTDNIINRINREINHDIDDIKFKVNHIKVISDEYDKDINDIKLVCKELIKNHAVRYEPGFMIGRCCMYCKEQYEYNSEDVTHLMGCPVLIAKRLKQYAIDYFGKYE